MIKFFIPGVPQSQKRHKHFNKTTKSGSNFSGTYDPSAKDKASFFSLAVQYKPAEVIDAPIKLTVDFYFPRPKSHYGTGRNASKLKQSAPKLHTKKPDLDNLVKFVKDALNKIFWRDDSLIYCTFSHKSYALEGGEIGTLVAIEEVE